MIQNRRSRWLLALLLVVSVAFLVSSGLSTTSQCEQLNDVSESLDRQSWQQSDDSTIE